MGQLGRHRRQRHRVSLGRCPGRPEHRVQAILLNTVAACIQLGKRKLRLRATLCGCFAEPDGGLRRALGLKQASQRQLRLDMSLGGGFFEPGCCLIEVVRDA